MHTSRYLWLLLCYAQYARSSLIEEYEAINNKFHYPADEQSEPLPIEIGKDRRSGCLCRASINRKVVVCFGNYECRKFPKITFPSERLRVRTTVIEQILKGDLDTYSYLKILEIEANHKLKILEPGTFKNLINLEQLSISFNTLLHEINNNTFEGLIKLRNLTLVNNGFKNIQQLIPAFKPSILPSLIRLDLSENAFETISEETFLPLKGTPLQKLELSLCRLDLVHKHSLNVFRHLNELSIGDNDLSVPMIEEFLQSMLDSGIKLIRLDLSGMGFRKQPPRHLMEIIGNSTIKDLNIARNQFEIIENDAFPIMKNIELIDLRKVLAILIGPYVFNPITFPKLKILLLSGNNLPGMHKTPVSNQLQILDLSDNKGSIKANPMYYEIDSDSFIESKELIILNVAFNRIRSVFDYTFEGLINLQFLNMENGTIYHIGDGTFKPLKKLLILNLANNPLEANQNLTSAQFEGLNALKKLSLENCGIKRFHEDDNIFEMMPNLTHLILRNNQLCFITAETIKPLKFLKMIDLSENLLTSWWKPLFLASGVTPATIYLTNNKISHFSLSMIQDISYLLEKRGNNMVEIDFMNNVFNCDCTAMYKAYRWLQVNGTESIKHFFYTSRFKCSNPDLWEDRRVADYLLSIKTLHCLMYEKISSLMVLVWTAPSLVTLVLVIIIIIIIYKYRMYIRYWMFLAKIALGRNIKNTTTKALELKRHKYDAFVSYCNDDRDFVTSLVTELENKHPYLKLCIYERDFEIGSFISEAIQTSIRESKYVVLIISNSFAKSQWCRWETQLAEYHRIFLEDGTSYDPLVLIRVGEVQSRYLTHTLKFLLKTKIYHTWDELNQEIFWQKLRSALVK